MIESERELLVWKKFLKKDGDGSIKEICLYEGDIIKLTFGELIGYGVVRRSHPIADAISTKFLIKIMKSNTVDDEGFPVGEMMRIQQPEAWDIEVLKSGEIYDEINLLSNL